jgi:hypothetical protein
MMLGRPLRTGTGQRRVSAVTILVGLVMLLVPALAWMQYQWLGQLSTAERERMQRTLKTAAAQFATEFDSGCRARSSACRSTVRRSAMRTGPPTRSAIRRGPIAPPNEARRDVWLVDGRRAPRCRCSTARRRFQPKNCGCTMERQALAFEDAEWPDDLIKMRDGLATRFIGFQVQRGRGFEPGSRREASMSVALGDDNTLVAPVTLFEIRTTTTARRRFRSSASRSCVSIRW